MNQLLSIVDDKIVIEKLNLRYLEGNILHAGNLNLRGTLSVGQAVTVEKDLTVTGTVKADTLHVKNLITDDARQTDAFTFNADEERQLSGKGLTWGIGDQEYQLVLKTEPRRIYSSESIDLNKNAKYQIDGIDVLLKDRLGSTITKSNITKLGVLESLDVEGNTNLSNTIIVNGYLNRVGINIEQPNGALSVVDGGVEFIVGSYETGKINIGAWSNNTLNIVTDNTPRISIHGNTVTFGSSTSKNAVVKINGSLEVDSIVSDTRVQRTSSLEFLEDNETKLHNKGFLWKGSSNVNKFVFYESPDRFYSSESIELRAGRDFIINGSSVLSADTLGSSVKNSSLERVGTLHSLIVGADVNLGDRLIIKDYDVTFKTAITVTQGDDSLQILGNSLISNSTFRIKTNDTQEFAISSQGITVGNSGNTTRVINAYGRLSINTTNPDPEAVLTVDGPVVMSGKKFVNGTGVPVSGNWSKGDIIWNINPVETSYVGWVCVASGTPGEWRPFGQIGAK